MTGDAVIQGWGQISSDPFYSTRVHWCNFALSLDKRCLRWLLSDAHAFTPRCRLCDLICLCQEKTEDYLLVSRRWSGQKPAHPVARNLLWLALSVAGGTNKSVHLLAWSDCMLSSVQWGRWPTDWDWMTALSHHSFTQDNELAIHPTPWCNRKKIPRILFSSTYNLMCLIYQVLYGKGCIWLV